MRSKLALPWKTVDMAMYLFYIRLVVRSFVRSFGRSVVRSFDRSIVRSFGRKVVRSFGRSVVRSFGRSVVRSFGRSVVRSFGRSVVRSVGRSVGRSFVCSFVSLFLVTCYCCLSLILVHFLSFSAWPQVIFPCVIAVDKENE